MDKSVLTKATSQDEAPTPGYMLNDISKWTHASLEDCEKLVEFLAARVQKPHHCIKLKSLKVIAVRARGSARARDLAACTHVCVSVCVPEHGADGPAGVQAQHAAAR
jgi:hypothetical protein